MVDRKVVGDTTIHTEVVTVRTGRCVGEKANGDRCTVDLVSGWLAGKLLGVSHGNEEVRAFRREGGVVTGLYCHRHADQAKS